MANTAAVHPNAPKNYLDFSAKYRGNVDAFKRICRIIALAVKTFAAKTTYAPLLVFSAAASFAHDTINALQVVNPIAYFYKGDFAKKDAAHTDRIINTADLYLSICDVVGWVQDHAKDLATYAANVGKSSPIFRSVVCTNISAYALPAALVLCTADLYNASHKLSAAANVVDRNKAVFSIAKDVTSIACAALTMAALTAPLAVTGIVALQFTNLFVGLASDGYNINNPS